VLFSFARRERFSEEFHAFEPRRALTGFDRPKMWKSLWIFPPAISPRPYHPGSPG